MNVNGVVNTNALLSDVERLIEDGDVQDASLQKSLLGDVKLNTTTAALSCSRSVKDDLILNPDIEPAANDDKFSSEKAQLSLEALIELITDENKALGAKGAKEAVSANAQDRTVENEKRIKELETQIDKLKEKANMSLIEKIMNYVSAAVQLICAIGACVAAVFCPATAPLAVMSLVMALDSALTAFSDGKYSIAQAINKFAEAIGASGTFATVLNAIVSIAMVAGTIAASMVNPAGAAMNVVAKVVQAAGSIAQCVTKLAQAGVQMYTGIEGAKLNREVSESQSRELVLQGILAQLDSFVERDMEALKELIKENNAMTESIEAILENINDGLKASIQAPV